MLICFEISKGAGLTATVKYMLTAAVKIVFSTLLQGKYLALARSSARFFTGTHTNVRGVNRNKSRQCILVIGIARVSFIRDDSQ